MHSSRAPQPVKLLGFYDAKQPYYEFTNFGGEGRCYNRMGDWAQYSEIIFQAAKFNYLLDPHNKNAHVVDAIRQEYFRTVKTPRDAFDFMNKPRREFGGQTINKVASKNGWHAINSTFANVSVPNKDIEMAYCLVSKFDPINHGNLLNHLIQAAGQQTVLVEESPSDSYWGWKRDKKGNPGKNALGLLLTALARAAQQPGYNLLTAQNKVHVVLQEYQQLLMQFKGFDFQHPKGPVAHHQPAHQRSDHRPHHPRSNHTASPNVMFPHAKPKPDSKEVVEAADQMASEIVTNAKKVDANFNVNQKFIVRKGNINGTFKVGFPDAASAQAFLAHLQKGNFATNVTYYGDKESYPMDERGRVVKGGKYSHVIRFEAPEKVLDYLQAIRVGEREKLYKTIMGLTPKADHRRGLKS